MKKKMLTSERRWRLAGHIVMIILSVLAIVPFILLIVASFTDDGTAMRNGYQFFPELWSLDAYKYLFGQKLMIGRAYLVTIIVTVAGTVISILITSVFGYALSKKNMPGRRILLFLVTFTMLFNGGATATYIIYSQLFHIKNTIWALMIPNLLMNAFSVMMFRNYFENSIPEALLEAARIDGASEGRIFFKIVWPLSLPIIATVGMTVALGYWNDWINGMYYLSTDSKLQSIQTIMNNINENVRFLQQNQLNNLTVDTSSIPSTTIRMAIGVVGILPILIAYPFFQKWFVRGITVGAVKE